MSTDTATRTSGHPVRSRLDRRLATHFVTTVVAIYLACRFVSFLMMSWVAGHQDPAGIPGGPQNGASPGYLDMTRVWDAEWYRRIVQEGYPRQLPYDDAGQLQQNQWAFYPIFPAVVRVLMTLTGGSFALVASTLSLVLGGAAVVMMAHLIRERLGPFVAICAVAVFCASPPSPVLQMAYTESLALLLLTSFLWAVSRERWSVAVLLALLTGLARPVALPLGLVALVAVVWRWRARSQRPIARSEYAWMGASLVSCGLSGLMWPAIAAWWTGSESAYTDTMATWRGGGEIVPVRPWLDNFRYAFGENLGPWVLAALALLLVVTLAGPWARGLGPVLLTWTVGYLIYLVAVLDVWTSTYRYLLFAFPLAIIAIGGGWAPDDPRSSRFRFVGLRTVVLVLLGLGWQLWWVWELLRIRPPVDFPI